MDRGTWIDWNSVDPFTAASLLKQYLSSLPDSLYPAAAFESSLSVRSGKTPLTPKIPMEDPATAIPLLKQILKSLPAINYKYLCVIISYFEQVTKFTERTQLQHQLLTKFLDNKMQASTIAIAIGSTVVLNKSYNEDPQKFLNAMNHAPTLVEFMINNCVSLFS